MPEENKSNKTNKNAKTENSGDDSNESGKQRREFVRALSMLTQIGVMMVACILIGVFLGRFLDNLLGTSPWLLLACTFLGLGAAFKSMYDYSKKQ